MIGTYTFKSGKEKGTKYFFGAEVCNSPLCICTDLTLFFYDDESCEAKQEYKHKVVIDISGPTKQTDGHNLTDEDLKFADDLIEDFDGEDRKFMVNTFCFLKAKLTEDADLKDFQVDFPEEASNGGMVGYDEIFPFGEDFVIMVNGYNLWAQDQHCVLPRCKCTELALHIMLKVKRDGQHFIGEEFITVKYDYKKNSWKEVDRSGLEGVSEKECINSLIEKYNNITTRLLRRDSQIKQLYKNSQKIARLEMKSLVPDDTSSIGRNDPCTCGSGKKYKKCCGK